mgnify:FL=1
MNQTGFEQKPKNKSIGALIGIFIVLVLMIVGGLYFWGKRLQNQTSTQSTNNTTSQAPIADDLNSIQSDLNVAGSANTTNDLNEINNQLK